MRSWLIETAGRAGQGRRRPAAVRATWPTPTTSLADLESARSTYADALILAQQNNASPTSGRVRLLHKMGDIDLQRLNWREAQSVYEQIKNLAPG